MKILAVNIRLLLIALGSVVIVACGENAEPAGPAASSGAGGAGGSSGATGGVSGAGSGALGGAGTGTGGTAGTTSGGAGGVGSSAGVGGAGGASAGGATGGISGIGGGPAGSAGVPAGGGGASNAGTAGSIAGAGASTGGAGGATGSLTITPSEELWTGVRFYTGSTPSNRTSGPNQGPSAVFQVHNGSESTASVSVTLAGTDAEFFEIIEPMTFPVDVAAGADLDVTLRLVTDNAGLGAAPAQDDGATVLEASLTAAAGTSAPSVRFYALVLTYVELEPTFGQILDAFPAWRSNIPASIRNDANPNPGTLPGVEAGTDEVAAPAFTKAVTGMPVTMFPIGRFSPPGQVPFGYHTPGNAGQRTTAGTLAEADDAHTNDKSRMLLPPLASGMTAFDPGSAPFAIFMEPAGVGTLSSEDAEGFDGAHRVKIWTLRDSENNVIPNSYLVGGEEAANGDYQDYVFVLSNVVPE